MERREIIVTDLPIRGAEWRLVRNYGLGTYAYVAGVEYDDADVCIVIEELDADSDRNRINSLTDEAMVDWVYDEILNELGASAFIEPSAK